MKTRAEPESANSYYCIVRVRVRVQIEAHNFLVLYLSISSTSISCSRSLLIATKCKSDLSSHDLISSTSTTFGCTVVNKGKCVKWRTERPNESASETGTKTSCIPYDVSIHERHEVAAAIDARRDPVQQNQTVECAAERPVRSEARIGVHVHLYE